MTEPACDLIITLANDASLPVFKLLWVLHTVIVQGIVSFDENCKTVDLTDWSLAAASAFNDVGLQQPSMLSAYVVCVLQWCMRRTLWATHVVLPEWSEHVRFAHYIGAPHDYMQELARVAIERTPVDFGILASWEWFIPVMDLLPEVKEYSTLFDNLVGRAQYTDQTWWTDRIVYSRVCSDRMIGQWVRRLKGKTSYIGNLSYTCVKEWILDHADMSVMKAWLDRPLDRMLVVRTMIRTASQRDKEHMLKFFKEHPDWIETALTVVREIPHKSHIENALRKMTNHKR